MFKPVDAKNIDDYFAQLSEDRVEIITYLDTLIKQTVPSLKPYFANNMLGYGKFEYLDYKKRTGEWPVIALASQKNYVSLYVCGLIDGQYVAEKYKDELGKVSVGKSCIRFNKIDNLNIPTLKKVLKQAEKMPGLVTNK